MSRARAMWTCWFFFFGSASLCDCYLSSARLSSTLANLSLNAQFRTQRACSQAAPARWKETEIQYIWNAINSCMEVVKGFFHVRISQSKWCTLIQCELTVHTPAGPQRGWGHPVLDLALLGATFDKPLSHQGRNGNATLTVITKELLDRLMKIALCYD